MTYFRFVFFFWGFLFSLIILVLMVMGSHWELGVLQKNQQLLKVRLHQLQSNINETSKERYKEKQWEKGGVYETK